MPTVAVSNGSPDSDVWWTGVLTPGPQIPANVTRGLSIIINPLVRLPWRFSAGLMPAWCADPMALNVARPGIEDAGFRPFLSRESRFDFWSRWLQDAIFWGLGLFSYVPDSSGQPTQGSLLRHAPHQLYSPADEVGQDWALLWRGQQYAVDDRGDVLDPAGNPAGRRLHFIRGLSGGGIYGRHALELLLASRVTRYASETFDSGVPSGVLTTDQPITQSQAEQARTEWNATQWRRQIAVLGNGARYQQVVMSPVDAELVAMSRLTNEQVAHMLELAAYQLDADTSSNTYANIVDRRAEFIDGTEAAWAARIEESISALLPWGQTMSIDFTEYRMPTSKENPDAAASA